MLTGEHEPKLGSMLQPSVVDDSQDAGRGGSADRDRRDATQGTLQVAVAGGVAVVFFPTLAVGLLDFKVDVVLAQLEADFSDQPPSIPAVPDHQVSLQCPTNEYPCNA